MNDDLTSTLTDIARGITPQPAPDPVRSQARLAARRVIEQSPDADAEFVGAMCWLEGQRVGLKLWEESLDRLDPRTHRDTSDTCPRCGRLHDGTGCRCAEESRP